MLAAMLMAGVDGIKSGIDPKANHFGPYDTDVARQSVEFRNKITSVPTSLHHALTSLADDHAFLLEGGVFSEPFIAHWIETKHRQDAREIATRPHPYEFHLYLDV